MENENNNLEDFLRKKLSNIERAEEPWAKPNLSIRKEVLGEIIKPAQKERRKKILFFFLLLGLLIPIAYKAWSIGIIKNMNLPALSPKLVNKNIEEKIVSSQLNDGYKKGQEGKLIETLLGEQARITKEELLERNELLKKVVKKQEAAIVALKEAKMSSKEESTCEGSVEMKSTVNGLKAKNEQLLTMNARLLLEQRNLELSNRQQTRKIESLEKEKELLSDELNAYLLAEEEKESPSSKTEVNDLRMLKPIVVHHIEKDKDAKFIENILDDGFKLEQPKKKMKFELGYQLGARGAMVKMIRYLDSQRSTTDKAENKLLLSHMHGLNFSVSPFRNFWIGTGFHIGMMNLHEWHDVSVVFDAAETQIGSTGALEDRLSISSNFGSRAFFNNIHLIIPQGIVDGDLLDVQFQSNLVLQHYQIPLEFNYRFGSRKLQGLLKLGGQWNVTNYEYSLHGFLAASNNQNLDFSEKEGHKYSFSNEYIGLYVGGGFNYNISKHWNVQGLLSYEYNFIDPQQGSNKLGINQFAVGGGNSSSAISNMGFSIKLRLNYRF